MYFPFHQVRFWLFSHSSRANDVTTSPSTGTDIQKYRRLEKHTARCGRLAERLKLPPFPPRVSAFTHSQTLTLSDCTCSRSVSAGQIVALLHSPSHSSWQDGSDTVCVLSPSYSGSCLAPLVGQGVRIIVFVFAEPDQTRQTTREKEDDEKSLWSLLVILSELSIPGPYGLWPYCPLSK